MACTAANANGAGLTQSFTLSAAAPGAATATGVVNLGPLRLQGPTVGLADFGFKDGMVVLTVAIGLDRATLALGNTTQPGSSPVTVDLTGILGTFDVAVDAFGLLSGNFRVNVPGKFSLRIAGLEAKVPDVVTITAEGIQIQYDPAGPISQELLRINSATVVFPKFGVRGIIRPFDPNAGHNVTDPGNAPGIVPGLVVRGNGFSLGVVEIRIGGTPAPNSTPGTATAGDGKIRLGSILEFDDIRIGVQNFSVTVGAAVNFNGSIYVASGGAKLFPGGAFSVSISDRTTADDRNPDGTPNDEAIRLQLTFANGKVDSFQMQVDTLEVKLSTFVTLTARDFRLDTGASAKQELVSFQSVGAKVKIGPLDISGDARNFAFLGDGTFKAKSGFGVFLGVGSATGDAFGVPSILGVRIDEIGIQWENIETHPEDFVLTVSASVTGVKLIPGLEVSGSIRGMKIQPSLLADGKFPIVAIDAFGVSIKGKLFGGELDASLLGGILKLDKNFNIIGTFDNTTPVTQRVFYLGIEGGFSMAGMAGFTIRLGLSELGPLQVMINVEVPGGLLLEPITGLSMNDFVASVEFFKTLPSIDDPFALRNPDFQLPTQISVADWLTSLQGQVARQAKTLHDNPGQSGFAAAFTSPMVITGSAKIYTIYTSQQVFNGQVTVKISTDGKILIIGKLNFAADQISISGRLYADLSKISSGNATVLFLADIPDQVRLLTLYGKLKMGFTNASGEEDDVRRRRRPDGAGRGLDGADRGPRRPGGERRDCRHQRRDRRRGESDHTERAELPRRRLPGAGRLVARLRVDHQHEHALHDHRRGDRRRAADDQRAAEADGDAVARRRPRGRRAHVRRGDADRVALGPEPRGLRRRDAGPARRLQRSGSRRLPVRGRQRPERGVGRGHDGAEDDRARARDRGDDSRPTGGHRRVPGQPARGCGAQDGHEPLPLRPRHGRMDARRRHRELPGGRLQERERDPRRRHRLDRRLERRVRAEVHRAGRDGAARRPGRERDGRREPPQRPHLDRRAVRRAGRHEDRRRLDHRPRSGVHAHRPGHRLGRARRRPRPVADHGRPGRRGRDAHLPLLAVRPLRADRRRDAHLPRQRVVVQPPHAAGRLVGDDRPAVPRRRLPRSRVRTTATSSWRGPSATTWRARQRSHCASSTRGRTTCRSRRAAGR